MLKNVFALALLALVSTSALGQTYNAANDFSATSNPTSGGIWRYGSAPITAGVPNTSLFSIYNTLNNTAVPGLDVWHGSAGIDPNVTHNGTSSTLTCCGGDLIVWSPNEMSIGPNPNTASIVRFTAPQSAFYLFDAVFNDNQNGGDNGNAYVLHNGAVLFNGTPGTIVNSGVNFSSGVQLNAGDFLDFAVGPGADNNPTGNHTQLLASITATPEPAAWALWAIGGGLGLVALRVVRRKQASDMLPCSQSTRPCRFRVRIALE